MKIKDFEVYKDNPIEKDGIVLRRYVKKDSGDGYVPMINGDSGEVEYFKSIGNGIERKHDSLMYRKVYYNCLPDVMLLSSGGLRVWCYILSVLKAGRDSVEIDMDECREYTGYSSKIMIYNGIIDLLNHKFIFRKVGSGAIYFINVNYFFNGNRI